MKTKDWQIVALVALVMLVIWFAVPEFLLSRHGKVANAGEFGDVYGSINALYSGLAFAALIATVVLQRRELHQNTAELKNSAEALARQVQLMSLSARLQALPMLIEQEKALISQLGEQFGDFPEQVHTLESLQQLVTGIFTDKIKEQESCAAFMKCQEQAPHLDFRADYEKANNRLSRRTNELHHIRRLRALIEELDSCYRTICHIGTLPATTHASSTPPSSAPDTESSLPT